MSEIKPTVYLDIHGVLADFVGSIGQLFGIDNLTEAWRKSISPSENLFEAIDIACDSLKHLTEEEIRKKVDEAGSEFWSEIPYHSWAKQMYDYLNNSFSVILLTSPFGNSSSAKGIINWIHDFAGNSCRDYILCPSKNKYRLSKVGYVLIDDYGAVVKEFNKGAGKGILFPMPWNTRGVAGGFDEVVKVLHKVERYVESLNQDDKEPSDKPKIFT